MAVSPEMESTPFYYQPEVQRAGHHENQNGLGQKINLQTIISNSLLANFCWIFLIVENFAKHLNLFQLLRKVRVKQYFIKRTKKDWIFKIIILKYFKYFFNNISKYSKYSLISYPIQKGLILIFEALIKYQEKTIYKKWVSWVGKKKEMTIIMKMKIVNTS